MLNSSWCSRRLHFGSIWVPFGVISGHSGRPQSNFRSIPLSDSILIPLRILLDSSWIPLGAILGPQVRPRVGGLRALWGALWRFGGDPKAIWKQFLSNLD